MVHNREFDEKQKHKTHQKTKTENKKLFFTLYQNFIHRKLGGYVTSFNSVYFV